MPINTGEGTINVLEAAKIRLRNLFHSGVKVDLSFSSGKDSLCVASIIYDLILNGEIDRKQLRVIFIDEEGLYPSMVTQAELWRDKFISIGVEFNWFCLPVKQACVINNLASTESWITWEPGKEDVWMRKPPEYAIMHHPYLRYPGEMNYQKFCRKYSKGRVSVIGVRAAESLTRLQALAKIKPNMLNGKFYPIYDWSDSDVWLYIKERNLVFPDIYIRLYEAGVSKKMLRLCAFFGDKGTQGLRWIAETDHDLWNRIERREPNAYLVLLYWDSEMFGRQTRKRGELEDEQEEKDYYSLCKDMIFLHPEKYNIPPDTYETLGSWKSLFIRSNGIAKNYHYKTMYEGIRFGDPKRRTLRMLWSMIYNDYAEQREGET